MKKKPKDIGLGKSIHIEAIPEKVAIKIIEYNKARVREKKVAKIEECFSFKKKASISWINIIGSPSREVLDKIGRQFKIHHLTLEDITNFNQRPKIENHANYIFMILKMVYYDEAEKKISTEQMSIVLGSNFVISFQEKEDDAFASVPDRINNAKSRIRQLGSDYLTHVLIDIVVDNYLGVLEKVEEILDETETEVVENPTPKTMNIIHKLEREILFLRKSVWPLRGVLSNLQRIESKFIKKATEIYLNDVYDHTLQVNDTIETFSSMVSGMLDVYLSSVNNRMNEIMKVLTIIATIFIPLTFVTGLYGMNFRYMPEIYWKFGYPLVLLIMLGIGLTMLLLFKRNKWI